MAGLNLEKHIETLTDASVHWSIWCYVEVVGTIGFKNTGLHLDVGTTETQAQMQTDAVTELKANGDYIDADLTPITWLSDVT